MSTISEAYERANLERAWRWIRSNPDAIYKNYFRDAYSRFALADESLLDDLQDRLKRGIYEPSHACKIFLPKASGILRLYTLLTVEDQIVYQSLVNVVAEHLFPRARSRYFTEAFGHLYAGKSSVWFYRKWSDGYAKFNQAARDAVDRGLTFTASFDLTACYDSLDHGVLRHFLEELKCDAEFNQALTSWLSIWTATEHRIYHNHGIPQGPLGSGLLSEVVLQHFDRHYHPSGAPKRVRYLRYVDDIRLFAKSEADLRRMLIRLDTLSKDIGLFPQTSKIDIHEVADIEEELKSLSRPSEAPVQGNDVDQQKLRSRIVALTPHFEVENQTRFKFLLAHAIPSAKLNDRLWRIYSHRPDLYLSIMQYFRRYRALPKSVGNRLLSEISGPQLYPSITAAMLETAEDRLAPSQMAQFDRILKRLWDQSLQPDVKAVVGRLIFSRGLMTPARMKYAVRNTKNWWVRCQLVSALSPKTIGTDLLGQLINERVRDENGDVSIAAACQFGTNNIALSRPFKSIHPFGGKVLRSLGVLARIPAGTCGIDLSMSDLLGNSVKGMKWRSIFGKDYPRAEQQAIWCRALARTNVTAFVNAMDVFNDWLLTKLYAQDPSLGTYQTGNLGSILSSTKLMNSYPHLQAMVKNIHERRLESNLSHARVRKTGKPTGRIKFSYLKKAKRLMANAFKEISQKW